MSKSKMRRCLRCGKAIEVRAVFCPHCGAQSAEPHWNEYTSNALALYGSMIAFPVLLGSCYLGLTKLWPVWKEIQAHAPRAVQPNFSALLILGGVALGSVLLLTLINKLFKK